jgi:hypothetical protein
MAKSNVEFAESAPLTKADEDLLEYFKNLERSSLDTIDGAARQIISLVTTLLGLFFGVLAFKDNPTYLAMNLIKILGGLSAVVYIVALFFALDVVMPRSFNVPSADLAAMQKLLLDLFSQKSRSLLWSQIAFGAGTLGLLAVILLLLFRA